MLAPVVQVAPINNQLAALLSYNSAWLAGAASAKKYLGAE